MEDKVEIIEYYNFDDRGIGTCIRRTADGVELPVLGIPTIQACVKRIKYGEHRFYITKEEYEQRKTI